MTSKTAKNKAALILKKAKGMKKRIPWLKKVLKHDKVMKVPVKLAVIQLANKRWAAHLKEELVQ